MIVYQRIVEAVWEPLKFCFSKKSTFLPKKSLCLVKSTKFYILPSGEAFELGFRNLWPTLYRIYQTELEHTFSNLKWKVQGVEAQTVTFILNIAVIPLVMKGCNIHSVIQKWRESDAQFLKLWKLRNMYQNFQFKKIAHFQLKNELSAQYTKIHFWPPKL